MTYKTLGDIAQELEKMREDGMTLGAVKYALGKVYWQELDEEARARKAFEELNTK